MTRVDPGNLTCTEPGCERPKGNTGRGFTKQGLSNHFNKKHRDQKVTYTEVAASVEEVDRDLQKTAENVDYGTPGDEVVMGRIVTDSTSFMEDVKQVVGHSAEADVWIQHYVAAHGATGYEPVYFDEGDLDGWMVVGIDGACCDWTRKGSGYNHGKTFNCTGDFVANPFLGDARRIELGVLPRTAEGEACLDGEQRKWLYGPRGGMRKPDFTSALERLRSGTAIDPTELNLNEAVKPGLERAIMRILGWHSGTAETWEQRRHQIKQIIATTQTAPVVSLPSEGAPEPGTISLKARNTKLHVNTGQGWEEMDLEQFINNIRFAVRIS